MPSISSIGKMMRSKTEEEEDVMRRKKAEEDKEEENVEDREEGKRECHGDNEHSADENSEGRPILVTGLYLLKSTYLLY